MADKTPHQQLAELIGAGTSTLVPRIFEHLTDENEARVLLAAAPPGTVDELAERTGMPAPAVEEMLGVLFDRGLIFKSQKQESTRYYRVRSVVQFHDATGVALDLSPEVRALWKEWQDTEWKEYSKLVEKALPRPAARVIPVNVDLEPKAQVLAFEDLKDLVEGARRFAVTRCSCRVIDGACGKPIDVCIQVNKAADYAIERGTGRELTADETLTMLRKCEEDGLVHVADNHRALGHVICNCCGDCCINWASIRTGTGNFVAPSRYRAAVSEEECNGCELCVERCYFDALHMHDEEIWAVVEEEKCMGCGLCMVVCGPDAIALQSVRPEDFVPV